MSGLPLMRVFESTIYRVAKEYMYGSFVTSQNLREGTEC